MADYTKMEYSKGDVLLVDCSCGCKVFQRYSRMTQQTGVCIEYCPKHAAAPDMYEALKAWLKYAESDYSGDGMEAVGLTQKALAKVEGK